MSEPRKIEVSYDGGHWRAEIVPEYVGWFEAPSLTELIDAVTQVLTTAPLLFVVDRSTVDGRLDAELQFLDASEKSRAMVISSVKEF